MNTIVYNQTNKSELLQTIKKNKTKIYRIKNINEYVFLNSLICCLLSVVNDNKTDEKKIIITTIEEPEEV